MAYLCDQLQDIDFLHTRRLLIWNRYLQELAGLSIQTSQAQTDTKVEHNGHIFFIMTPSDTQPHLQTRRDKGIDITSHYEPLHETAMAQTHGRVSGTMAVTDMAKERLTHLALYVSLTNAEVDHTIASVQDIIS